MCIYLPLLSFTLITSGKPFEAQVYVCATGHYEPQHSVMVELWSNLTSLDWSGMPFTKTPLENVGTSNDMPAEKYVFTDYSITRSMKHGCILNLYIDAASH